MKPPRLAYLVSQYPSFNHTFVLREVRELRARGWDILTVSVHPPDRPPEALPTEEAAEYALTWYLLPLRRASALRAHLATLLRRPRAYLAALLRALALGHASPRQWLPGLSHFGAAVIIGAELHRRGFSHVHAHFTSTLALLISRLFSISYSATMHGPDEFLDPAGFALEQKIDASAFLVAISHYARSQLMRFSRPSHWDRFEVCPLGVDVRVFLPAPRPASPGPLHLLTVGRLAPVKGHHVLLGTLQRLVRQGRSVRLSLAGDGPLRAELESAVRRFGLSSHVSLLGWLDQKSIRELYRSADIFVLPSFAEGVPVVLMEAMAMEIPCVASRVNGVPELIRDQQDGLLTPPSDEEALAEALIRLMDSPELRRTLAVSGRRQVEERYNLQRNVARLSEIFAARLGVSLPASAPNPPEA